MSGVEQIVISIVIIVNVVGHLHCTWYILRTVRSSTVVFSIHLSPKTNRGIFI